MAADATVSCAGESRCQLLVGCQSYIEMYINHLPIPTGWTTSDADATVAAAGTSGVTPKEDEGMMSFVEGSS